MNTRIIAITVIICLFCSIQVCTFNVFADKFSDVPQDAEYFDAVTALSAKGVINGYPDGLFRPDNDVIRAEFTTMLIKGMEEPTPTLDLLEAELPFIDCGADDISYASVFISMAYNKGIINGVGDNRFEPKRNVTYEEAVKMVVCALGFEGDAVQKDGYPTGYLAVADENGLTEGVNGTVGANVKRWQIAQLIYNGYFKQIDIEDTETPVDDGSDNITDDNTEETRTSLGCAMIKSRRTGLNSEGNEVEILSCVNSKDAAPVTVTLSHDITVVGTESFGVGSVILVNFYNSLGEVKKMTVLTAVNFESDAVKYTSGLTGIKNSIKNMTYTFGKVVKKSGTVIEIEDTLNGGTNSLAIGNGIPVTICDFRLPTRSAVKVGSVSDIAFDKKTGAALDETIGTYYIFIREYRGEILDVSLYIVSKGI